MRPVHFGTRRRAIGGFLSARFPVGTLPSTGGYCVGDVTVDPAGSDRVDDESAPLMLAKPRGL